MDVATLPSAVISRVDIVTGGASAAWGSDAVAGVVNFVLNKNFTGWKSTVEGGDTYNNLNRSLSISTAWGDDVFGGRGHLVLAGTYLMRPDTTLMINENWYRGAYWVSNPAFAAGNGQPQLIVANDVGLAGGNVGGIITDQPCRHRRQQPLGRGDRRQCPARHRIRRRRHSAVGQFRQCHHRARFPTAAR